MTARSDEEARLALALGAMLLAFALIAQLTVFCCNASFVWQQYGLVTLITYSLATAILLALPVIKAHAADFVPHLRFAEWVLFAFVALISAEEITHATRDFHAPATESLVAAMLPEPTARTVVWALIIALSIGVTDVASRFLTVGTHFLLEARRHKRKRSHS